MHTSLKKKKYKNCRSARQPGTRNANLVLARKQPTYLSYLLNHSVLSLFPVIRRVPGCEFFLHNVIWILDLALELLNLLQFFGLFHPLPSLKHPHKDVLLKASKSVDCAFGPGCSSASQADCACRLPPGFVITSKNAFPSNEAKVILVFDQPGMGPNCRKIWRRY